MDTTARYQLSQLARDDNPTSKRIMWAHIEEFESLLRSWGAPENVVFALQKYRSDIADEMRRMERERKHE